MVLPRVKTMVPPQVKDLPSVIEVAPPHKMLIFFLHCLHCSKCSHLGAHAYIQGASKNWIITGLWNVSSFAKLHNKAPPSRWGHIVIDIAIVRNRAHLTVLLKFIFLAPCILLHPWIANTWWASGTFWSKSKEGDDGWITPLLLSGLLEHLQCWKHGSLRGLFDQHIGQGIPLMAFFQVWTQISAIRGRQKSSWRRYLGESLQTSELMFIWDLKMLSLSF